MLFHAESGSQCLHLAPSIRLRPRHLLVFITGALLLILLFTTHILLQDVPSTTLALDAAHDSYPSQDQMPNSTVPRSPRVLLVSAFFPLPTAKHSPEEYAAWLGQFLSHITAPIYFYTPTHHAETILSLRGSLPFTLNTTFATPFAVPPLQGREAAYTAMHAKDREAYLHTPNLYAVWNAKPWLLEAALAAARASGDEYDFAFWCDAGSFRRTHEYRAWPDASRIAQVFSESADTSALPPDQQIFFPLTHLPSRAARAWTPALGPLDEEISEGSFFGGASAGITWFASAFYSFHDAHLARGEFVGKDQTLFNALFVAFPARFRAVFFKDAYAPALTQGRLIWGLDRIPLGACGNDWWYYQFFLARREERERMRAHWLKEAAEISWWGGWEWWRERQTCRLTGVVEMHALLQRLFGESWTPPRWELGNGNRIELVS